MATSTPEQDPFEKYLQGKSPLSELYKQAQPAQPSALTDKRILNAAKASVETSSRAISSRGKRWVIPAIAASFVVMTVSILLISNINPLSDKSGLGPNQDIYINANSPHPDQQGETLFKKQPAAELWLAAIGNTLSKGKTEKAKKELRKFLQQYPGYPLGHHPKILQLARQLR